MNGKFEYLRENIIETGLCTRCGGCCAVCPVDAISFTSEGMKLTGECIGCGNCTSICPGGGIDLTEHENRLFGRSRKRPLGGNLGIYLDKKDLSAADRKIFKAGYFGGRVSAVLVNALEKDLIDAALVTDWSGPGTLSIGDGRVARSKEEVLQFASSKYVFSPVLCLLKVIRKDESIKKAALVGLPCHIHAFRNMQVNDSTRDLTLKVRYIISLNCGAANCDEDGWKRIIRRTTGVAEDDILDFRANKISGNKIRFTVTRMNGKVLEKVLPINRYLKEIAVAGVWKRCLICPDYSGDLSDVSFGMPYIRTRNGDELVRSALDSGQLVRSSFKRRFSQWFIDRIIPIRKRSRTRLNISRKKREGRPYPVYK